MIAKILGMRTLNKKSRMQADSLTEIRRGLEKMTFDLRGQRIGNRPVSEGHVINAAILVLLAMGEEERTRAVYSAFAKMNALLAVDEDEADRIREILAEGDGLPGSPRKVLKPKTFRPGEDGAKGVG